MSVTLKDNDDISNTSDQIRSDIISILKYDNQKSQQLTDTHC